MVRRYDNEQFIACRKRIWLGTWIIDKVWAFSVFNENWDDFYIAFENERKKDKKQEDEERIKIAQGFFGDELFADLFKEPEKPIDKYLKCASKCQTAHCGRCKPRFVLGEFTSPIVPYRNLPQAPDGMTADCCSLVWRAASAAFEIRPWQESQP